MISAETLHKIKAAPSGLPYFIHIPSHEASLQIGVAIETGAVVGEEFASLLG